MINSLDQIYECIEEFRKGEKYIIYSSIYGEDASDTWHIVNEDHNWNFQNNFYRIVDNIDCWEAIVAYSTQSITYEASSKKELLKKVFEEIKNNKEFDKVKIHMQRTIRS